MKKLHFFALIWCVYLICTTVIVVNAILWMPAAMLAWGLPGIGVGLLLLGGLLFAVSAAIDCTNA